MIKFVGWLLTGVFLLSFYKVLRNFSVKNPLFWTFFVFFAGPNSLSHFLRTRPQTISLILLPLLFYFIIRKKPWPVLGLAAAISWAHLNFSWLPIAILTIILIVRLGIERSFEWKVAGATALGVITGWFLRPDFLLAGKLLYIQLVKQIIEKQSGLPLLFGFENLPFSIPVFLSLFFVFLVIFSVAVWSLWKNFDRFDLDSRVAVISAMLISVVFLIVSLVVARRAHDLMVLFGILAAAIVFSKIKIGDIGKTGLSVALAVAVLYSGSKALINSSNNYPPDYLQESAKWLEDNSFSGDIVFNLHWSHFSPLFAWNNKNYYVGGLDPIFQYEYSPSLYWKFHYLSEDVVTKKTCGAPACTVEMLEDTYQVLKKDFGAKYIILTKAQNPAVNQFLSGDSRFVKTFENDSESVYLIK